MANTRFYFDEANTVNLPTGTKLNGGTPGALTKTVTAARPSTTTIPNVKPARPNLKPGKQHTKLHVKWLNVNVPGCTAEVNANGHIKGYLMLEDCRHGHMRRVEGYFSPMTFETDTRINNMIPTAKEPERKSYYSGSAYFYWFDTNGNEHCGCKISKEIKQTWYVVGEAK